MDKKEQHKRYLKKFEIVETKVELPIQGQVLDPEDLYQFLKDLENENVAKVIGIYLDDQNLFLGHQVFLGFSSKSFDTQLLYHYYALFLAKKFIVLINHPDSIDPTPDDADKKLIRVLQADAQVLSFKPFFADFIIVAKKSYFSMAIQDGTAGHGHQKPIEK
ncbi:MAG: JAB domain-containing protein [Candidatus Curtissbacteria bacterium]|nr:JAB domain-containing protein [Candidatus Curtissbacteria bacterium]